MCVLDCIRAFAAVIMLNVCCFIVAIVLQVLAADVDKVIFLSISTLTHTHLSTFKALVQ